MRTLYVVWKMKDGTLRSHTFEIDGKINHFTIKAEIEHFLFVSRSFYDMYDFDKIISWQVEEEFTTEEMEEFINNNF